MTIKIINKSNNPLPRYESAQAAGMDIRCHMAEAVTLQPLERKLLPTGLYIELPVGYEAQIRPRSGLALKRGLTVLNSTRCRLPRRDWRDTHQPEQRGTNHRTWRTHLPNGDRET